MKTKLKYNNGEICRCYNFTSEHKRTLFIVLHNNDGCIEFENRTSDIKEDMDGNEISWKICDELVDMGLLEEDEEAFDVYFEITSDGKEILKQISEKERIPKI